MLCSPSSRVLLVVCGSTGTGKSQLAVELCQRLRASSGGWNLEVINADAMQMYRGLEIATNKCSEGEQAGVPHHLFGHVTSPRAQLTVHDWMAQVRDCVQDMRSRGAVPLLCGGTHYYVHSLLVPTLTREAPWTERRMVGAEGEGGGPSAGSTADGGEETATQGEELWHQLQEVDPWMAERLHPRDVRKIRRSLEVWREYGRKHSDMLLQQGHEEHKQGMGREGGADMVGIVHLSCDPDLLQGRLEARCENMVRRGLVQEVLDFFHQCREQGVDCEQTSRGILQAIGCKEFLDLEHLVAEGKGDGDPSYNEVLKHCVDKLKAHTVKYAKGQVKFIKKKLFPHANKHFRLLRVHLTGERVVVLVSSTP